MELNNKWIKSDRIKTKSKLWLELDYQTELKFGGILIWSINEISMWLDIILINWEGEFKIKI